MRNILGLLSFAAGAVAFMRFFYFATRLNAERIGPPPTKLHKIFPWLPGRFTPEGQMIQRKMNGLLLLGWLLLVVGIFLSGA